MPAWLLSEHCWEHVELRCVRLWSDAAGEDDGIFPLIKVLCQHAALL